MSKILYVVHRYAPFPGGSENYVRDMAEETLSRGHEVAVFTGEHKGDWNGVRVSSDPQILLENWDLIVVHGGDVALQNFVLANSSRIQSPILFMLIIPSESDVYQHALHHCKFIGCSTKEDWEYAQRKGIIQKSVQITHGIDPKISTGKSGFRDKFGIKTELMFLSCGGYWHNKRMLELVNVFNQVGRYDVTLVTTGYDNRFNIKPQDGEYVRNIMLDDREDVLSAIKEADLYIMHSDREGFGLVLLESMLNGTPWAARNLAGAKLMNEHGFTYDTDEQLLKYMKEFKPVMQDKIDKSYEFVTTTHMISNTVDDILRLI